jgi:hypothetical protein
MTKNLPCTKRTHSRAAVVLVLVLASMVWSVCLVADVESLHAESSLGPWQGQVQAAKQAGNVTVSRSWIWCVDSVLLRPRLYLRPHFPSQSFRWSTLSQAGRLPPRPSPPRPHAERFWSPSLHSHLLTRLLSVRAPLCPSVPLFFPPGLGHFPLGRQSAERMS